MITFFYTFFYFEIKIYASTKIIDYYFCYLCRHYITQRDNPDTRWTLPEDFSIIYSEVQGEMTVGGVFLRLFIANPGWVLRKPKEFLTELLDKWTRLIDDTTVDVSKTWMCFLPSSSCCLHSQPPKGWRKNAFFCLQFPKMGQKYDNVGCFFFIVGRKIIHGLYR